LIAAASEVLAAFAWYQMQALGRRTQTRAVPLKREWNGEQYPLLNSVSHNEQSNGNAQQHAERVTKHE
jgi:hypothetical protein